LLFGLDPRGRRKTAPAFAKKTRRAAHRSEQPFDFNVIV
jgi:hypothetical protein